MQNPALALTETLRRVDVWDEASSTTGWRGLNIHRAWFLSRVPNCELVGDCEVGSKRWVPACELHNVCGFAVFLAFLASTCVRIHRLDSWRSVKLATAGAFTGTMTHFYWIAQAFASFLQQCLDVWVQEGWHCLRFTLQTAEGSLPNRVCKDCWRDWT